MGRLACVCLLALVATAAAEPSPQQRIALMAKPSVVRVWGAFVATYELGGEKIQQAIGGSGTGFFITPDGYIATNAHVVSDIYEGEIVAKERLYKQLLKQLDKAYAKELANLSEEEVEYVLRAIKLLDVQTRAYVVLPNGETLDYEIKEYGRPGSGRDAAILKVKIENAPTLPIGDSTRAQVADQIVVIGYPGVADMKALLDEASQLQASVTDGTISSLKHATSGEQILQISAPITHGNSGGPALDLKGNVVGLATFGNESEVQGFNFLVASSTLEQLLKAAKVEPKPSETNVLWQKGLEHYWADEYTPAIAKFHAVEKLFPAHSEAPELARLAEQAKQEGKEKKPQGGGNAALVVGLVIGGLVLVGGAGMLIARRKPGPAPVPHPHVVHAPAGYAPPGFGPPPYGAPVQPGYPPAQLPQMYGRAPAAPQLGVPVQMTAQQHQPIAKTLAIHSGVPAGGVAPTAFGSLSIGTLTCTRGQLTGQRFALTPTGLIVGRQPGIAHVLVNDHRASGKHVWIGLDQGRLVAIDQGTTNGTYINDVHRGRIARHELSDGDVVIVSEPDCLSLQVKLG